MQWLAPAKAITQKKNREPCSQNEVGIVKATPPKAAPKSTSVSTIHQRLVFTTLMSGLHTGFNIQGR